MKQAEAKGKIGVKTEKMHTKRNLIRSFGSAELRLKQEQKRTKEKSGKKEENEKRKQKTNLWLVVKEAEKGK